MLKFADNFAIIPYLGANTARLALRASSGLVDGHPSQVNEGLKPIELH